MENNIIAIDPGKDGSFVLLRIAEDNSISLTEVKSMKYTLQWEQHLYFWCKNYNPRTICLERVHSFTGQGVKSMFSFGEQCGLAKAAIRIAGGVPRLVEPSEWQRRLGLPHRSEILERSKRRTQHRKDQKELALQLFPQLADVKGDVYASVLIGYAACLDMLGIPLGQLTVR